ncbi:hypothetical protein CATMIT_01965, partial [Catenibacterium mitsuokai DSM 15897]
RSDVAGVVMQLGDRRGGVDPHRKQGEPGEELDHRQPRHRRRHRAEVVHHRGEAAAVADDAARQQRDAERGDQCGQHIQLAVEPEHRDRGRADAADHHPRGAEQQAAHPVALGRGLDRRRLVVGLQLLRRVFAAAQHGPADRQQQHRAAEIERVTHRVGHLAGGGGVADAEVRQQVRQQTRHHRAHADEEALHGVAGGALLLRQLVADEGAERLHRYVDRGVEHP